MNFLRFYFETRVIRDDLLSGCCIWREKLNVATRGLFIKYKDGICKINRIDPLIVHQCYSKD